MHELIREVLLKKLGNPILRELSDSALLPFKDKLAFTTDSFVVSPLFFPGGDIGKLAVCGTVNDLVMLGAVPEYISLGLIIEEGLEICLLEKIIDSISLAARAAGVTVATGDLKVVEKGACDKIFINTSGVGRVINGRSLSLKKISRGDKIILTGPCGRHGMAVLAKRKGLDLGFNIKSDCAALNKLLLPVLKNTDAVKFMRDPTRGGVATTLNEIAAGAKKGIVIEEDKVPVSSQVRAAGELLGIDPLYIANEGSALLVVKKSAAAKVLKALKSDPLGHKSAVIGEVTDTHRGRVILKTILGTKRIIDMLTGEPLPRIC